MLTVGIAPVSEGEPMDPAASGVGHVVLYPLGPFQRDRRVGIPRDADDARFAITEPAIQVFHQEVPATCGIRGRPRGSEG